MMEAAVEKHQPRETAMQRLARHSGALFVALLRLAALAAIMLPVMLASMLTVDIPVYVFDRFVGDAIASRPSNWLSRGLFIMAFVPLIVILFSRRFGGDEASRAVTAAWGLAAVAVFAELSYLAPVLESSDLPSVRFTIAFTASAMAAQYVAASVYDVARGGGRWWRAPLFGALGGYFIGGLIYFPAIYLGTGAPWFNWMIGGFSINSVLAFGFLATYWLLRKPLRPRGGFGGR
ncbi:hypothetical protein ABFZ85_05060 [Hyphococcus formosus]|uniref:hypothetical protein n=1 Tax=Hyphococcus formosus TaxID=3143534 RepID=UPI00398A6287